MVSIVCCVKTIRCTIKQFATIDSVFNLLCLKSLICGYFDTLVLILHIVEERVVAKRNTVNGNAMGNELSCKTVVNGNEMARKDTCMNAEYAHNFGKAGKVTVSLRYINIHIYIYIYIYIHIYIYIYTVDRRPNFSAVPI